MLSTTKSLKERGTDLGMMAQSVISAFWEIDTGGLHIPAQHELLSDLVRQCLKIKRVTALGSIPGPLRERKESQRALF